MLARDLQTFLKMDHKIWKHVKEEGTKLSLKPLNEEVRRVQAIQEHLYTETTAQVDFLLNALRKIEREHLDEVVLERASQAIAGYRYVRTK